MHRKQRSGIAEIFAIAFIAGFVFVAFCIVASFVFMMTRKGGYHEEKGAIYWCGWSAASGDSRAWVTDDCEHFEKINFSYAKDSKFVYCGEEKIEGADPGSFELISGGPYAKDKNAVYCQNIKVQQADPKTFRVLEIPYARDHLSIFNGSLRLNVRSPDEFEVRNLGTPSIQQGRMLEADRKKWESLLGRRIEPNEPYCFGNGQAFSGEQKFVGFKSIN